ncbi:hypothetical protein SLEP1_g17032 [Rubroshorea leprosula]|uniref:Uncharacterized protein n=1 Tax=Rubroshorea leprosula TaxID=152421 RepID=A0AAV5J234_9ROSI|nr:hypothetical protein SLEP1_g17032 [Rubroshorea leprosula]
MRGFKATSCELVRELIENPSHSSSSSRFGPRYDCRQLSTIAQTIAIILIFSSKIPNCCYLP